MSQSRILFAGGLGLVGVAGIWLVKRLRQGSGYDDLDSIVSFSSRLVAGMRALESQEEEPLMVDPLAEALAGQRGMDAARSTVQEYKQGAESGNAHPGASKRKYQVGRVTLRTLFFDKHLLAALRSGARQVVLLGAGMDSRAWRLDLPPGVAWFEVDRQDVLKAKHKVLTAAGASFSAEGSEAGAQFPLMAASYTSCSLDLEHRGWSQDLVAAGFDPTVPAVWIAEGLVMYLSEDGVVNLMREARSISAKGSRLLVMAFTTQDVKRWYQESATSLPTQWVRDLAATFKSSFPADAAPYLAGQGWNATDLMKYSNLAEQYAKGLQWTTHLGVGGGHNIMTSDNANLYIDATAEHEKFVEAVVAQK